VSVCVFVWSMHSFRARTTSHYCRKLGIFFSSISCM